MAPLSSRLILTISLLLAFICHAYPQSQDLIIGKTATFHSNILQEDRPLLISLPASASDTYFYPRHYPVLYLLDGDSHFYAVAGLIRELSRNSGLNFPEIIIVGLPNTHRNRDLTPTHIGPIPSMDSLSASQTGGGENFIRFISRELIPHIDSLYPTVPYRLFMGHSLGGLTVIHTLIHHASLFNGYVAIDPSMWWDNGTILQQATAALKKDTLTRQSLFLAIANSYLTLPKCAEKGIDSSLLIAHMNAVIALRDQLTEAGARPRGIHSSWKFYPDYEHTDVAPAAAYDALRFLFRDYAMEIDPFFSTTPRQSDTSISQHYRTVSRQLGYTVLPPEPIINDLGYYCLSTRQLDRAHYLFQLNIDNYPASFNVYDSMGDFYLATGNRMKAIELFKQALALRDNPDTRKKLMQLQSGG